MTMPYLAKTGPLALALACLSMQPLSDEPQGKPGFQGKPATMGSSNSRADHGVG